MLNTNEENKMETKLNNSQALSALSEHYLNNDGCLYFDGANWYIQTGDKEVTIYTTGDKLNITKYVMSEEWSERYIKNNNVRSMEKFLYYIRMYRDTVQGVS